MIRSSVFYSLPHSNSLCPPWVVVSLAPGFGVVSVFSQPYIKPGSIGNVVDKSSRTTLTKYMNELTQYDILTPKKDGLEVYYLNNDLIRILGG